MFVSEYDAGNVAGGSYQTKNYFELRNSLDVHKRSRVDCELFVCFLVRLCLAI